jgi:hypothetical protein
MALLGLANPQAAVPTRCIKAELSAARSQKRHIWWVLWGMHHVLHRAERQLERFENFIRDEIAAASPTKTFFEVMIGLPIALLAFPGYREALSGWGGAIWFFPVLIAVRLLYGAHRRAKRKDVVLKEVGDALKAVLAVVESCRHQAAGSPTGPPLHLQHNIANILRAVAALTSQVLQAPNTAKISANLMLPMPVEVESNGRVSGCGIVVYDHVPAAPSWTRVVLGDPAAGEVLATGKVKAIEDTRDPIWCGVFLPSRAHSFASFPLRNDRQEVIGVVNVDSTRAMVFNRDNATALYRDILAAPLMLLSELLQTAGAASTNPGASP